MRKSEIYYEGRDEVSAKKIFIIFYFTFWFRLLCPIDVMLVGQLEDDVAG